MVGPCWVPRCFLGASWVPPGWLVDASCVPPVWMPPGCFLEKMMTLMMKMTTTTMKNDYDDVDDGGNANDCDDD